jgi:hypothetical protein
MDGVGLVSSACRLGDFEICVLLRTMARHGLIRISEMCFPCSSTTSYVHSTHRTSSQSRIRMWKIPLLFSEHGMLMRQTIAEIVFKISL